MKTITKLTFMFAFIMMITMSACTTGKTDSSVVAPDTDSVIVVDSDSVKADSVKIDSVKADSAKLADSVFAVQK